MADPISILNGAIELARKLRDVSQKIKDADTKNLVGDLSIALADLKIEIADLKEENLRLQTELAASSQRQPLRQHLELRDGVYWLDTEVAGHRPGAYCPACFEDREALIPLSKAGSVWVRHGKWKCPSCGKFLGSSDGGSAGSFQSVPITRR